eukprot:CAMPEP_0202906964 /NCGR_PEP_ID=MMETSP1392-20130828/40863_1 /ASSEMBLY_ACC=CAM_ASM_000868 /TAXON_ID=225041 /ORGANISM="Chlamydomonas chlamydogama, Strain SAG 11-48b" /LENGTH=77 /DNA_ID=CAMNT_0049595675 /DNA_START=582 /DNA_END=812 /DNA_ORIENTATION=-
MIAPPAPPLRVGPQLTLLMVALVVPLTYEFGNAIQVDMSTVQTILFEVPMLLPSAFVPDEALLVVATRTPEPPAPLP